MCAVNRALVNRMAPVVRPLIASESSVSEVRAEIASDRDSYLLWACATWFTLGSIAALSALVCTVLTSAWDGFDVIARALLLVMAGAFIVCGFYTILLAVERRRERGKPKGEPVSYLREDLDDAARLHAAKSLAEALRPRGGRVWVELGDPLPKPLQLLERAQALPLTATDSTGRVWEGTPKNPEVWAWALDCLENASAWELYEGTARGVEPLMGADDSLSEAWVQTRVAPEDPQGWWIPGE